MSEAAIVFTALSGGLNAVGTLAQGKSAAIQADFQANQLRQRAVREQQEAAAQAAAIRRQRSRESSRLRARLAASGIDTSTGSALLSLETLSGDAELEVLTALNQAAFRANMLEGDANLTRFRGRAAQRDSVRRAGTTLLTTAAQVARK